MDMHNYFADCLNQIKDNMLDMIVVCIEKLWPVFAVFIGIKVAIELFSYLISPKHESKVFDENFENDFDLMYDMFADQYDSEDDFINDYFSDFSDFPDEPDIDELAELGFWGDLSEDYIDEETAFFREYEDDFYISYDDFDGSFSDYVEGQE